MKAVLEFNLEDSGEERDAFTRACRADDAYRALWEISQNVFRPARKHGYRDEGMQDLLAKCGVNGEGEELVGALEKMFYEILNESGVSLDEYS